MIHLLITIGLVGIGLYVSVLGVLLIATVACAAVAGILGGICGIVSLIEKGLYAAGCLIGKILCGIGRFAYKLITGKRTNKPPEPTELKSEYIVDDYSMEHDLSEYDDVDETEVTEDADAMAEDLWERDRL